MSTSKRSVFGKWTPAGSITTEHVELPVTGRDVATADALATEYTIKISPPTPMPYAMLLRFRAVGTEDVDDILQLYAARGNDFYRRIAILTTIIGTSDTDTSTIHFIDTITATEEDGHHDAEEQNLTDNRTATYYLRTFGCDRFLILASDLDSTTLYCDVCWLWE